MCGPGHGGKLRSGGGMNRVFELGNVHFQLLEGEFLFTLLPLGLLLHLLLFLLRGV
jgi:hypothetical protein